MDIDVDIDVDDIKNILIVAAHPDDIEYGVAGTLLKYRNSLNPHFFIVTCGGVNDGTAGETRYQEALKALSVFGTGKVQRGNLVGISHEDYPMLVQMVEECIKTHGVSIVMTHAPNDTHQDHRLATEIVVTACRRQNVSLLYYPLLSTLHDFVPDIYVDITDQLEQKREMLSQHESQKDKPYMSSEYVELFNSDRFARLHGIRHCERFKIERMFL